MLPAFTHRQAVEVGALMKREVMSLLELKKHYVIVQDDRVEVLS